MQSIRALRGNFTRAEIIYRAHACLFFCLAFLLGDRLLLSFSLGCAADRCVYIRAKRIMRTVRFAGLVVRREKFGVGRAGRFILIGIGGTRHCAEGLCKLAVNVFADDSSSCWFRIGLTFGGVMLECGKNHRCNNWKISDVKGLMCIYK